MKKGKKKGAGLEGFGERFFPPGLVFALSVISAVAVPSFRRLRQRPLSNASILASSAPITHAFLSWEVMIVTAAPVMKPAITEWDRKLMKKDRRNTPTAV